MPELERISIEGFKSIASIEKLKLNAINVVIGANGAGKSNFVGIFPFIQATQTGRLSEYVVKAGGANKVLHFGTKVTSQLRVELSFGEPGGSGMTLTIEAAGVDQLQLVGTQYAIVTGSATPPDQRALQQWLHQHVSNWRLYHFHDTGASSPMKRTSDLNDNRYLRADGSNLPAFLYFLREKHVASYELIRKVVQQVAPFFDDFVLAPQMLNLEKILLEWRHKGSDAYFDASSFSDGTLRFIALAALFLQPQEYRPSLILVDEPELGLHPYAVALLASLAKQAAATTQVILSTQSPSLLDHFPPEDVLVADRVNGGTQLTRLDAGRLDKWLEDYSLGQLWEKNEIGGRPGGA